MSELLRKVKESFKNCDRCNPEDYHIKKIYTKFIHRGLVIVKIINTREKKFLAHYTPSNLTILFESYGEAEVCANLMKSYYKKLDRKWK